MDEGRQFAIRKPGFYLGSKRTLLPQRHTFCTVQSFAVTPCSTRHKTLVKHNMQNHSEAHTGFGAQSAAILQLYTTRTTTTTTTTIICSPGIQDHVACGMEHGAWSMFPWSAAAETVVGALLPRRTRVPSGCTIDDRVPASVPRHQ